MAMSGIGLETSSQSFGREGIERNEGIEMIDMSPTRNQPLVRQHPVNEKVANERFPRLRNAGQKATNFARKIPSTIINFFVKPQETTKSLNSLLGTSVRVANDGSVINDEDGDSTGETRGNLERVIDATLTHAGSMLINTALIAIGIPVKVLGTAAKLTLGGLAVVLMGICKGLKAMWDHPIGKKVIIALLIVAVLAGLAAGGYFIATAGLSTLAIFGIIMGVYAGIQTAFSLLQQKQINHLKHMMDQSAAPSQPQISDLQRENRLLKLQLAERNAANQ